MILNSNGSKFEQCFMRGVRGVFTAFPRLVNVLTRFMKSASAPSWWPYFQKVQFYIKIFQNFQGGTNALRMQEKCTISHTDFEIFPGVTPSNPDCIEAGQTHCIFGPTVLKGS